MSLCAAPLNNLAQEMASQDEGFQERIAQMFTQWIDAFEVMFDIFLLSIGIFSD